MSKLEWTELDKKAVDTVRVLAADAVEKVGNGHPGTAISLAPVAYMLYHKVMNHDPSDMNWIGRDRFILSCGHSSLTQYIQLYLSGYDVSLDDLKALRTFGSNTPAHPEYGHTDGVEMTTGPLGQGLATAVGFAYGQRRLRGLMDPEAKQGESPFDHHIYVLASDGDIMEGITSEAGSLAGHQELGNLVVIYDQNKISIEDDTDISFTEDVLKRYEAYGWHTQEVNWRKGEEYYEDVDALYEAIETAKAETGKPSIISLKTIIGWPSPTKQNTGKIHGSALGEEELRGLKETLAFDPDKTFDVSDKVLDHTHETKKKGKKLHKEWHKKLEKWEKDHKEEAELLERLKTYELPKGWDKALPTFSDDSPISTRKASGQVLTAIGPELPELWGGSADLAESNNTTIEGSPSFIPKEHQTEEWRGGPYGRVLHFGIREHAAAAIVNGITLTSHTRAFAGTFLVFSDYQKPAIRLSAIMKIPSIYVWTHDSIGLGEDGATHQPVEHLWALRSIPGFDVVRPADANEVTVAWKTILNNTDRPAGIILTRQDVPVFNRKDNASANDVAKGGYILSEAKGSKPEVILIATGSEVAIAMEAQEKLEKEGTATRVVSMPCVEWFNEQTKAYQDKVLPKDVKARVSIEAGHGIGWREYVGDAGQVISLDHYGASGDYKTLYKEFGFTPEAVVEAAQKSIKEAGK
ncbi:MAG: transketolase [Micrococcaceae bacterium]